MTAKSEHAAIKEIQTSLLHDTTSSMLVDEMTQLLASMREERTSRLENASSALSNMVLSKFFKK